MVVITVTDGDVVGIDRVCNPKQQAMSTVPNNNRQLWKARKTQV